MKNKELVATAIYLIVMFGAGFGFGCVIVEEKYNEQLYINENIYKAYEELRTNYDILEIQFKRDLESCYTQLGDYQDKVEAGCFVNGGWNCE